ncbi:hypothetical protein BGZ54_007266 [Gamsiella multidivaricata]|nr:hypothetical protein BGZ54_007266 [Gamsiella multidivaricata]
MAGAVIRVATRLGHQANARNLSYAPTLAHLHRSVFYSTSTTEPSKNAAAAPVQPHPAPLEDLIKPIGAGTAGSVAPENIHNTVDPVAAALQSPPNAGVVGKARDFFRKGKEIVIQCKDGVKMLWVNKKIVKDLKRAQKEEGHQLTRREFQLIHQTDMNLKRLIPFGLVFILATEYIPLIIIFAPQLIPTTCVTPSQLEGLRKKTHEKRSAMTEKLIRLNRREINKEALANYNSFITIAKKYGEGFDYSMIDHQHLASFCRFMGLNGFGPKFLLTKRLDKYMRYIKEDDLLIQKDGVDSLTFAELQLANEERGMRSLEVSKEHLEKSLAYWLKLSLSKDATVPPALMVFSRMFLLHSTFKSDAGKK